MTEAPEVTSAESATCFVHWCIEHIGLGYHPDNLFADYVEASGAPVFSSAEAERLDHLQGLAFDFIDPYEVGLVEFHRMMDTGSDSVQLVPKN